MLTRKQSVLVLCAVLFSCGLCASTAMAQSTPYSAMNPSMDLVTNGVFKTSPLALPFAQTKVESVTSGATVNFKHSTSEPYDKVIDFFQSKTNRKAGFTLINSKVYPHIPQGIKLRVFGARTLKTGGMEFQLGHPKISRRFRLRVTRNGGNADVTFLNVVHTNLTSGVGPARKGFLPVGSKVEVPFRWN